MRNKTKLCALLVLLAVFVCVFISCGKKDADADAVQLSFKSASSYDYLKGIDGEQVTINGYMATSSPVDGSFIFLMNLPYQSYPFCVPNTTELSNTIEVYPAKGEDFTAFTNQAIKVVGTLVVAENEDEPFEDEFGYKFNFKIVDASFRIIKAEELSENMATFQKIADSGIVNDMYKMYEYVNFVCAWNTYYVNNYTDADGNVQPGYYLWADDAKNFIYKDGAQYNYGYKDGYFDGLVRKIEAVDKEAFADLVANVKAAESLANKAISELEAGNYTSEKKFVEMFGKEDYVFTLGNGEELMEEMDELYTFFSDWLGSLEL